MVVTEGEVWAKQRKLYIPGLNLDFWRVAYPHCGEVQSLRGQVRWGCGEWHRDEYSWSVRRVRLTSFWRRLGSRWWNKRGIGDTADNSRTHRGSWGEYEHSHIENVWITAHV
jgi:hypothetical protein